MYKYDKKIQEEKMKFWITTNDYIPNNGGLVSYTRNLAQEIKKQGNVNLL